MNRKTFTGVLALTLVCLVFSFLTGCSSSSSTPPPPTIAITAVSADATQSTTVGTAFANPLGVTVTSNGSPDSGATVTYAATTSTGGATCTLSATTATTNSSGQVTSVTCTANGTAGSYTVTATVSGASTPATFNLTNNAGTVITAVAADATQSTTAGTAFPNPLGVNVTSNGSADSGATVTYAATTSTGGATCTLSATTATTDANGNVNSVTCTANGTAGSYTVTATVSGATAPATFNLTNTAPSIFTFYVTGLEVANGANGGEASYYAIAGAVSFDSSGNFLGGEQDYNDGNGITATDTFGVTGSGFSSTVMTTGQGTLTLVTSPIDANVGVAGTETFAVQFVNPSHALISQFDGSATSSGSMDLQSKTTESNFAFTISGTDSGYKPVGYGGVFTVGTGSPAPITGTADANDDYVPLPAFEAGNLSGSVTAKADPYGRGTATITITESSTQSVTLSLVYYHVTAEVLRLIDIDPGGVTESGSAAVGSAYGQQCPTTGCAFDSTALGTTDVFGVQGNSEDLYAEAGSLVTAGTAVGTANATFTGEGDADWGGDVASDETTAGSYTIASNGYGSATITGLATVALPYGLYATSPSVNLLDPNNTSGGGGALLLDLYPSLSDGTGVVVPQATTPAADLNNPYGFGAQMFTNETALNGWEFDYVAGGTISSLALTGTGEVSDPYGWFTGTEDQYSAVAFAGTATGPDAAGRYAFPAEGTANNFVIGPVVTGGTANDFTVVLYEATPNLVFSIDEDTYALSLGTYQVQAAGSGDAKRRKVAPALKVTKKR